MPQYQGGGTTLYAPTISDALADPKTSTEQLHELRDSAHKLLKEQGDLPGALKALEAEIANRSGGHRG